MKNILAVVGACVVLVSCGKEEERVTSKSDGTGVDASNVASDAELANGTISANVDSSISAMAENGSASPSTTLTSAPELAAGEKSFTFTRTCAVDGDSAVVTVKVSGEHAKTQENKVIKKTSSLSGESTQTRKWTMTGTPIPCSTDGKHAKIAWKENLAGLKLNVDFSRSRTKSMEFTNIKKNVTKTIAQTSSFKGTHEVTWVQADKADDTTSTYRKKSITTNVERTLKLKNKAGEEKSFIQTVTTKTGAPMVVSVVRSATDLSLTSKTIESGTVTAKNKDESWVETSYTAVKVSFADGKCTFDSGTMNTKFFEKGATTAAKSVTVAFEDGAGTATDDATKETREFEAPICDPEDID
jgi:hypothetical protein